MAPTAAGGDYPHSAVHPLLCGKCRVMAMARFCCSLPLAAGCSIVDPKSKTPLGRHEWGFRTMTPWTCSDESEDAAIAANAPLAVRMRPRDLDEFVGQQDFPRPGQAAAAHARGRPAQQPDLLRPAGHGQDDAGPRHRPPLLECDFHALNAASASVKEVREIIEQARAAAGRDGHGAPSCSSTSCTASTAPSRTCCCTTWRTARSSSSARRRRTRSSPSTRRC